MGSAPADLPQHEVLLTVFSRTLGTIVLAVGTLLTPAALPEPRIASFAIVDRIAGPDGQWDYAIVDDSRRRVLVARSYGAMTIDIIAGRLGQLIVPGNHVHGVVAIGTTGLFASSNGGVPIQ
jgi:hypothetical protein